MTTMHLQLQALIQVLCLELRMELNPLPRVVPKLRSCYSWGGSGKKTKIECLICFEFPEQAVVVVAFVEREYGRDWQ